MKNITQELTKLFKQGYCTPQIARLAKKLKQPSTTLHYNIKKLEKEKAIRSYKAVFDYNKIGKKFCAFVLISLSPDEHGDPEKIGKELSKYPFIESVDIITGGWEMILKIRVKDQYEYYDFIKDVRLKKGVLRIRSLTSLKQFKTEFVELE